MVLLFLIKTFLILLLIFLLGNFISKPYIECGMIITVSGKAGSGKSTIAKALAKKLNLRHYSIGDLMRQIASEQHISLMELGRLAENDETIDRELDKKQVELRKSDNFVIDGRLTSFFIPNAQLRVFLDCDDTIRAKRIFDENRKDESSKDLNETIAKIKQREQSERIRYEQLYKVDYYDKKLYNLIVDTTHLNISQVLDKILEALGNKTKTL
jgi:CMP/dCMP kinase